MNDTSRFIKIPMENLSDISSKRPLMMTKNDFKNMIICADNIPKPPISREELKEKYGKINIMDFKV